MSGKTCGSFEVVSKCSFYFLRWLVVGFLLVSLSLILTPSLDRFTVLESLLETAPSPPIMAPPGASDAAVRAMKVQTSVKRNAEERTSFLTEMMKWEKNVGSRAQRGWLPLPSSLLFRSIELLLSHPSLIVSNQTNHHGPPSTNLRRSKSATSS